MVTACYAAPTLCDIVKHVQDMVNQIFQFKGLSCQQAETLLAGIGGQAERRAHVALHLSAAARRQHPGGGRAGLPHPAAPRGIRDARTGREVAGGSSTDLIRDTLKRGQDNLGHGNPDTDAGMIDMQTFAEEVLGRFELKRGATDDEPLDVDITPPTKRVYDVYRTERSQLGSKIDDAVGIIGNPSASPERRQAPGGVAAGPGHAVRGAAGAVRHQGDRSDGVRRLQATSWPATSPCWRSPGGWGELRDLLEAGMLDNTELSEAESGHHQGAAVSAGKRERDRFLEREGTDGAPRAAGACRPSCGTTASARRQEAGPHDGRRRGRYGNGGQPLRAANIPLGYGY